MASTKIENPGECPVVLEKTQAQILKSVEAAEWSLARFPRKQYEELIARWQTKLASGNPNAVFEEVAWTSFELAKRAATVEIVNRIFVEGETVETVNPVELGKRFVAVREELERETLRFARRSSVSSNLDRNMADIAKANAQGDVLEELQKDYWAKFVQNLLGFETAPKDEAEAISRLSFADKLVYGFWKEQKLAYQQQEAKAQAKREADRAKREAAKVK